MAFAISVMPEDGFARAALPLFDLGIVDMVEWSLDMGWGPLGTPSWLDALLADYADAGRLIGHGVSFSLLGGAWTPRHDAWLERLRRETGERHYRHVSEHLGFIGGGRFSFSSPLPMPVCDAVVRLGQRRMRRLADAAGCGVGLENLATSLGWRDADDQGMLLDRLLAPVDGFAVLDLHNLWCQAVNVGRDPEALARSHSLRRVREIHVSGGSWDRVHPRIRRDTHDARVPEPVLGLLRAVAPDCPQLEVVVHERLGTTLADPAAHGAYREDVARTAATVVDLAPATAATSGSSCAHVGTHTDAPRISPTGARGEDADEAVAAYQAEVLDVLHAGRDGIAMAARLGAASTSHLARTVEVDPVLAEVAAGLTRTWARDAADA